MGCQRDAGRLQTTRGFSKRARSPSGGASRLECTATLPDANAQEPAKKAGFEYVYPNGAKSSELNVPANEPIEIVLESTDVVHAFFISTFRVKQDIIPGRVSEVWFEANRESTVPHQAVCAGHCGTEHSSPVVVHKTRAAFEDWLRTFDGPRKGEKVYDMDCKACHTLDGVMGIGPSFKGLFGATRKVLNTKTGEVEDNKVADAAYLAESIQFPGLFLSREGKEFGDLMDKSLWNKLKPQEVKNIIKFIRELK